ncbi:HTH domain-containing protein [Haloferax sp. KTX1]|uniref:HTH domain-containing protein n=1 Tax=Haloferax sp. KTX1 TaxID=2600597 RepID=UPI0011DD7872|nr:HTH domain-containing protein [Haloferax sp. KTX1]
MDTIVSDERPTPREGTVRIELWVPSGRRAEFTPVIERLDDAVERGLVSEYTVETWDRFVDLGGELSPRERRARDRLASYARWAAMRGDKLDGLGDPESRGVGRMGPERPMRRTPRAVMAEYENGVLAHVTACEECVGAFRGRLRDLDPTAERERPSEPVRIEW